MSIVILELPLPVLLRLLCTVFKSSTAYLKKELVRGMYASTNSAGLNALNALLFTGKFLKSSLISKNLDLNLPFSVNSTMCFNGLSGIPL